MEKKIELGKRYFLRMRPVRILPLIGWGFTSSNDPDPWVECEVDLLLYRSEERIYAKKYYRRKPEENYRLMERNY